MLLFIDTNIFLNFYRFDNDASLEYVDKLEKVCDKIIMTHIIEMEFLKNRQQVLMSTLSQISQVNEINFPEILSDDEIVKTIPEDVRGINSKIRETQEKVQDIIEDYKNKHEVYKNFRKFFEKNDEYTLMSDSEDFDEIYLRATKRFHLGYPPRKSKDLSIGDSINWEWIIEVCRREKSDLIIVSRDSDYGPIFKGKKIISDWLHEEFKRRVGSEQKVTINQHFTQTLKQYFEIDFTKEQIEYEIEHSSSNSASLKSKKEGNFINYLRPLPMDKRYQEIELRN